MEGASQGKRRRVDAAHNVQRITAEAWRAFAQQGTNVQLEVIAELAGVGTATLYRHFGTKENLVCAIIRWRFAVEIEPIIERALQDDDPWRAIVTVLEAALNMASRERNTLLAARHDAAAALADRLLDALTVIMFRAQAKRLVRADLVPDDLARITAMLIGVLQLEEQPAENWRRCLALLLDALRPGAATTLPPAAH